MGANERIMKRAFSKLRSFLFLVCIYWSASIHAFEVGNVCYQVNDDNLTVSVVKPNRNYCNSSSVQVPEKVTYGGRIFTVTTICSNAFTYQAASVTLPSTIEKIEERAFEKSEVFAVYFRGNPKFTTIPRRCFFLCHYLDEITIPHSVTTIESDAFVGCHKLKKIVVPSSVIKIEASAFDDGRYAKESRYTMREIVFEEGGADLVIHPHSYDQSISDVCKKVYVGRNIIMFPPYEKVESSWFGWQLEEATIGVNVNKLSNHLFCYCNELKSLKIEALSPPSISKNTFSGIDKKNVRSMYPRDKWKGMKVCLFGMNSIIFVKCLNNDPISKRFSIISADATCQ